METSLTIVKYSDDGQQLSTCQVAPEQLNSKVMVYFLKQVNYLTGDLELPLEDRVPGDIPHLEYRIMSDLNSTCTFYYYHDQIIHVSLVLLGRDDDSEAEMAQTIRFLLLDEEDRDEPTEEERNLILASPRFDFLGIDKRPVGFSIPWTQSGVEEQLQAHVANIDKHLIAALCQ